MPPYTDPDGFKSPGQLVLAKLDQLGWSQRVLAIVLDIHVTSISKIVADHKPVTAELALALGDILGVEPERLLQLQKSYELAKARLKAMPDPSRNIRAHLFGGLPVTEMIRRGWLKAEDIRDVEIVTAELARFFGEDSVDRIEILPHAAKKTNVSMEVTPAQLAWLYRVKRIGEDMVTPRFSPGAIADVVTSLSALRSSPDLTRKVPRLLAECGVRFMLVEALPSSKIDGVCLWLDDKSPVVALSLRYDRIDNFWFVLRHELEHVIRGHGKEAMMLDAELEGASAGIGADIAEDERVANAAAAEFCVSQAMMQKFIVRKAPFFREPDVLAFAKLMRVHPGLVAGQLQRLTDKYELFRQHLVKVRSSIAPSAIVDGWGSVYPLN